MFISTISPEQADGAVAEAYTAVSEDWGFLPNWVRVFSHRLEVLAAWQQLSGTIGRGMDRRRYELATVAAARTLRSTYCAMAHTWMLRDHLNAHQNVELQAILSDPDSAPALDDTDRAVMVFAEQVARDASAITAEDVDDLRRRGLSDRDVLDVALAAGARCFFAKVLDAVGATPDRELADLVGPELEGLLTVGRAPDSFVGSPQRTRGGTADKAG
jgi:uncharacterized peroxidase-related enzyme